MRKRSPRKPLQIREWRKAKGLTQEKVIAALPKDYTAASLSRLENGQMAYTQETLEALAKALDCEPHELFKRPSEVALWRRIDALTGDDKDRALAMLEAAYGKLRTN